MGESGETSKEKETEGKCINCKDTYANVNGGRDFQIGDAADNSYPTKEVCFDFSTYRLPFSSVDSNSSDEIDKGPFFHVEIIELTTLILFPSEADDVNEIDPWKKRDNLSEIITIRVDQTHRTVLDPENLPLNCLQTFVPSPITLLFLINNGSALWASPPIWKWPHEA
ncbi:unnamed protein product [Dovyalis caffra]|uniref:Uncharacterized protein n=1 Tax=Dovyalis caffra TaxID=77055 RepID=A0AAV1RCN2_9ROSI|nr:unnamed protein product [Dovyalis caffra]